MKAQEHWKYLVNRCAIWIKIFLKQREREREREREKEREYKAIFYSWKIDFWK